MKTISNYLKTNLINLIGWSILLMAAMSVIICFCYAVFAGNNLIAHPLF